MLLRQARLFCVERVWRKSRQEGTARTAPTNRGSEFDPDALGDPDLHLARNVDLVVGWALGGDPISSRVPSDVGHELGLAVANTCQIVNPECVMVGGALAKAGPIFMEPLTGAVHGLTTLLPGWPVPIVVSRLQEPLNCSEPLRWACGPRTRILELGSPRWLRGRCPIRHGSLRKRPITQFI